MNTASTLSWRMPPLVLISLWLHAAALAGLALWPVTWPWIIAMIIANHALITFTGLWPRSTWLGPNWTALPPACAAKNQIALTIDDGPDPEVTPQVLDLLDRHGVKATFFCIGDRASRYPDMCRDIIARGHDVENHSQSHSHCFSVMGPTGLKREVGKGQATLEQITGVRPRFFRAPAGLRNPFLDPVLHRLGLRLAAWTRRGYDTRTGDAGLIAQRLLKDLRPGAILLVHDGNCARSPEGRPVILDVLPLVFAAADRANLRFITLSAALHSTS